MNSGDIVGMGVGGFIARSRSRGPNMRGRGLGRGGPGLLPAGRGGRGAGPMIDVKKQRRQQKKSVLEESFPAYLQEAFFGRPILDNTNNEKLELNDEAYTADLDSGLASSTPHIHSSIKLKDPCVFHEDDSNSQQKVIINKQEERSPMLSQVALTPRSNSQVSQLTLSSVIKVLSVL